MKNIQKLLNILSHQKKFFVCVCVCMYKMVQISKEGYKNVKSKLLTKEDTFGQIEKI